jgi:hypothetical protein
MEITIKDNCQDEQTKWGLEKKRSQQNVLVFVLDKLLRLGGN